jgi:hypothetical protein
MITVSADPLRRDIGRTKGEAKASLPYFDSEEDEIKDEWDNPQIPLKALINRVKKINLTLYVPSKINEIEVNELKEGIFSSLHLTPARDEIVIQRRQWVTQEVPWIIIYVSAAILISLLLGLLFINKSSSNRIAAALGDLKTLSGANSSQNIPSAVPMTEPESKSSRNKDSQEVKFADPIKMKELASRNIEFLLKEPGFPNHHDIYLLDGFGHDHPDKLGAVLAEFPSAMQEKLFSYSADSHWVEALNEPGFLDFACLEVFQAMTQHPRSKEDVEWHRTVLAVWRLNDHRTQFLRQLSKEEAFALLNEMPKSVSVSEARKSFPGAWAAILDPSFKPAPLAAKRAKEIQNLAIQTVPLYNLAQVAQYRSERELLDYLKTADPAEERDIYGAAPATSLIHSLRPPFFVLFDQPSDVLQWFANLISTEQWALALFNLPKSERSKVDTHLSEKQRFLLIERFRRYDTNPPGRNTIGEAREQVARALKKWLDERNVANKINGEIDSLTGTFDDKTKKAA